MRSPDAVGPALIRFAAVAAIATASIAACAQMDEAAYPEPGDPGRGAKLVQERCSSCHAVGREGRSRYPAAPPLRTLHKKYDVEGLAEAFAEGILVHHKGEKPMPEFVLTPEEIDDLIAYLRTLED